MPFTKAYQAFRCTRRGFARLCFALAVIGLNVEVTAAQSNLSYVVQANIIYQITKYIEWPASHQQGDFVIGIVGDSPLYDELKSFVANKSVQQQRIVVRKFPVSSGAFDCQILFIPEERSGSLKKIVSTTQGQSILLVSESAGLAVKGSCINFVNVRDHLKLEINKNNIQERHLHIANELIRLGIIVQ